MRAIRAVLVGVCCIGGAAACSGGGDEGLVGSASDQAARGGGVYAVAPTDGSVAPGVVVWGTGRVTVPADAAEVVLSPGTDAFEPVTLSRADRRDLAAALDQLGYPTDAVRVTTTAYSEQVVGVRVPLDGLPTSAEAIEGAVEDVVGRVGTSGVSFGVTACSAGLGPARADAVADARRQAEALAEAGDVALGPLTTLVEGPSRAAAMGEGGDPCDLGGPPNLASLVAYDAPREVELDLAVRASFAIAGASGAPGLAVEGAASIATAADGATVVVLPADPYVTTEPSSVDPSDRQRLVDELAAQGIDATSIRIEDVSTVYGIPGLVRAEVDVEIDQLPDIGDAIVDVVEDVTGSAGEAGVQFTSSRCAELLVEAQRDAIADADARLASLADPSGTVPGEMVTLAPPTALAPFFAPTPDPCGPDVMSDPFDPYAGFDLEPFDAAPEAEIEARVVVARTVQA